MSYVRIYMLKDQNAWLSEHPIIYDNSGKGWFYDEDRVCTGRGDWEKGQSWTYLSKDCRHHSEKTTKADPEWELVAEL
jgi:hypothetical protein